ncbi:MarR family winged helix-turn-helix transcriptional regulator [Xanthomonas massiliensis]|uniref:MarR family winged helix-turn-helix transcriptional regulator n=1 Tax=Xanthomonas massiliensis TaxID=1720302 RepID=UPI000826E373|nr:MarR family transcriptional regulator [Xanthomonas massiliensis]
MPENTAGRAPAGNPGFRLNVVSRQLTRYFDRRLGELGVNVSYLPVLGALRESKRLSQKELVQAGRIGQPAMAQMLERMVKEGLLVRTPDATDGRKVLFGLSKKAETKMTDIRSTLADGNDRIFSTLADAEFEAFIASLEKIEARLEALLEAGE